MDELLDIYNEDGSWKGTAMRSDVHSQGLWHKTAQVWLINEKDELLLQFRSAEKDCFPELWDISSAGHIPAGTAPIVSAVRELEEELGVKCSEEDLTELFTFSEPYVDERSGHIDREVAVVFLLKVSSDTSFILQEEEVSGVRWIHYEKLLEDFYEKRSTYVPHEKHFNKLVETLRQLMA